MKRPAMRALARRLGVIDAYVDQTGRRVVRTSDTSREQLLQVMGFDAPTEDAARGWLAELDHERALSIVDTVRVVQRDAAASRSVRVRVPRGMGAARVEMIVTSEAGHESRVSREMRGNGALRIPAALPYGYHQVEVRVSGRGGGREREARQTLIVVPSRCMSPATWLRSDRAFGVVANLYAARRENDWGVGDFTTLARLVEWGARRGADFVGVNPLHALFNRGTDVSPYSPVSRLFRNHIYIDVENVPSLAADRAGALGHLLGEAARLRAGQLVPYDPAIALKERALREGYRRFRQAATPEERSAFADFVQQREPELTRHALWMVLAEDSGIPDWRAWPDALRHPDSPSVQAFGAAHGERVDFHRWLQFETDRQLHEVALHARALGMRVGVYQDLAIGTNPGGSDTWSWPDLFLTGASVGAPPDPYSASGQNWGLPPMDPRALRAQGYRYWIQLLRRAFEHAGALRIDHVMGLFRVFWIPDGGTGRDGAYVRFPSADLLGILALESERHNAMVVGEDLGTVPPDVPPALRKWGVLSSKVLYFEQSGGRFRPASRYPEQSLATANTHDMPSVASFWMGRDIALRREVGLIGSDAALRATLRLRDRERRALLDRLGLEWPEPDETGEFLRTLTAAVHRFLCSSRSRLVGLSWDDLLGELEPVNVPGVGQDRYPSWRRRNRITVEEASWSAAVDGAVGCHSRRRGGGDVG